MRNNRLIAALFFVVSVFATGGASLVSAADSDKETLETMHRVFDSLTYLLPLSLNADRFFDESEQSAIKDSINILHNSAKQLEQHAGNQDQDFNLLAKSFSDTVQELKRYYDDGQPEYAQLYLFDLTQHCAACHSRLPSAREFPFAERLTDRVMPELLSRQEQVQLQVATRQFEQALATWEAHFSDMTVDPVNIDLDGDLIDYLVVNIRVLHQLDRPKSTLTDFSRRLDLPFYIRRHLGFWLESFDQLQTEMDAAPSISRARSLFTQSTELSPFPGGRERVLHDLVASSILYRYIDQQAGQPREDLAEAYYMLGIIEARTARPYWSVPQVEFLFEAAIRAAPDSDVAQNAFAILEEYSLLGASSPYVLERVELLRQLVKPL